MLLGFVLLLWTTASGAPKTCAPGLYLVSGNHPGQEQSCLACPVGRFGGGEGCISCAAGRYGVLSGQALESDACQSCPPGKFSKLGKSQEVQSLVKCKACEPGRFSASAGEPKCGYCEPGKASTAAAAVTCERCGPGRYAHASHRFWWKFFGGSTCEACPAGKFTRLTTIYHDGLDGHPVPYNVTECHQCAPGKFSDVVGVSSCKLCRAGRYSNRWSSSHAECSSCPAGKYQSRSSAGSCVTCGKNMIQAGQASPTRCGACPSGTFAVFHHQKCAPCAKGKYRTFSHEGGATCDLCTYGRFQAGTGKLSCKGCGLGQYTPDRGSSLCQLCPIGKYQPRTSAFECNLCSAGKCQPRNGSVSCEKCWGGNSSTAGSAACSACPSGKYYSAELCHPCLAGQFQPKAQQSYCLPCPAGDKCPNSHPVHCAQGTYSRPGALRCSSCPLGKQWDLTFSCSICPAGKYSNSQSKLCEACSAGRFQPDSGFTFCAKCPAGKHQLNQGQTACTLAESTALLADLRAQAKKIAEGAKVCSVPAVSGRVVIVSLSGTGAPGSAVKYSCPARFELLGDSRRVCGSDLKWSGTMPSCNFVMQRGKQSNRRAKPGKRHAPRVAARGSAHHPTSGLPLSTVILLLVFFAAPLPLCLKSRQGPNSGSDACSTEHSEVLPLEEKRAETPRQIDLPQTKSHVELDISYQNC
jgi:hypothetical protein